MREKLQAIEDDRDLFSGVFERYGSKGQYKGHPLKTVLLLDIKDAHGNHMTDHSWFNLTKGFESLGPLNQGDQIGFRARVKEYVKGSARRGRKIQTDYRLSHPSKVHLLAKKEKLIQGAFGAEFFVNN